MGIMGMKTLSLIVLQSLLVIGLFFPSTTGNATEFANNTIIGAEVPMNVQAAIFSKVLSYDANLDNRSAKGITMAVVVDQQTKNRQNQISTKFRSFLKKSFPKHSSDVRIVFFSAPSFSADIANAQTNLIYLPDGSADKTIKSSVDLANSQRIPLLSGSEKAIHLGGAVGVTIEGSKPKIVINLAKSKKQGMKLSAKVLQIAKIVK